MRSTFFETFPPVQHHTRESWLEGFERDADPEREVLLWEMIEAAYGSCL